MSFGSLADIRPKRAQSLVTATTDRSRPRSLGRIGNTQTSSCRGRSESSSSRSQSALSVRNRWVHRSLRSDPLDIWQLPCFVEQRLFGTVEAEKNFELPARAGRHPIRLFAGRSLGTEIDIHRTVGVLLQARAL